MREERRRYESAFENLFEKGKNAAKQLASFHSTVKDDKVLRQNTDKVMAFAIANPDKVAIGIGLAASSWLLYQSICLGSEIERFFDEIEELKGLFKEYFQFEMPKLEKLYHKAREVAADYVGLKKQKEYLNEVYDELTKYYDELQKAMDKVDDAIEDVKKGKKDADITATVSVIMTALSVGAAAVATGPVAVLSAWILAMSAVSTTMSLKNASDLGKASKQLKTLKQDLRRLKENVKKKMVETMELIDEIKYKEICAFRKILVVSLVICLVVGIVVGVIRKYF